MEVLKEYGIEERILGEAGNNASVNDKTLDELEILFKEISSLIIMGRETQIRCFAHILNLIVKVCLITRFRVSNSLVPKAILSQFEAKRRKKRSSDTTETSRSR